jgi:DNA-binding LytR/AlgR family response regulator
MKALIVDDEPLARRELRRLLAAHRSIQIVGEAGDIDEAHERIESLAREISVFSAEGNYVRMQWGPERPLLGRSLAALESKLDPQRFFARTGSRSSIWNLFAVWI